VAPLNPSACPLNWTARGATPRSVDALKTATGAKSESGIWVSETPTCRPDARMLAPNS
jgi:hypothetical protein